MKTKFNVCLLSICNIAWLFIMVIIFSAPAGAKATNIKFDRMWPKLPQPWYFASPKDLAFDSKGYLFIADTGGHRIIKMSANGQFITEWGGSGSNNGQFNSPTGIAIDSQDNIYVTDENNRVQKFTNNGQFIIKWGNSGKAAGQFDQPRGIAIDAANNVYVADSNNHRIQKFDLKGNFIDQWGTFGKGDGQFKYPSFIGIDSQNCLYIGEQGIYSASGDFYSNFRIQKFTSDGIFLLKWGSEGHDDGQFYNPAGIVVDKNNLIYVAEAWDNQIKIFSSEGKFIKKIQKKSGSMPWGLALDGKDHIFVCDTYNYIISEFSFNGSLITTWGSGGYNDGEFVTPSSIATDSSGDLFVIDSRNFRLQKFDKNGQFIESWSLHKPPFFLSYDSYPGQRAITQNINGDLYIAANYHNTGIVLRVTTSGTVIAKWDGLGFLDGIATDSDGNVYVTERNNHVIKKFNADGKYLSSWGGMGTGDGQFNFPAGITVHGDKVFVADKWNSRIQVFNLNGNYLDKWGTYGSGEGQFDAPISISLDPSGNVYILESVGRIQKFDSNKTFIATVGSFGTNAGQMRNPSGMSLSLNGEKIYVADCDNNRIQVFVTGNSTTGNAGSPNINALPKAIIVAGGGPYPGNNLWESTQICANFSYRALSYQGYTKDTIYYLSSDTDLDLDGNGMPDDVDADATNANFKTAITSWAADATDLTIYITNHGGDNKFRMGETELLSSKELNDWLNQLQTATNMKVTIVYDACQSGSFLTELSNTNYDRIFIASTSKDQQAYFTSQGLISFSYYFWGNIFNGISLYDSYLLAKNAVEFSYSFQTPLLNADGNTIGNEDFDMDLIQGINIGNGVVSADDIPVIGSISDTTTLNGENKATIFADNVIDANGISKVWAIITPPDNGTADPSNPVLKLPEVKLTKTSGNLYEGSYDGFNKNGTYNIAVFAKDSKGTLSIPKSTSVIQAAGQNYAGLNSALAMSIPCLEFQGTCYNITLDQYTNPSDGLNLFWKLDINSTSINQSCSSDCSSMDSDLQIIIPKIEYAGNFYQIVLNKHFNSIDPFSFYWMLDLSSVKAL